MWRIIHILHTQCAQLAGNFASLASDLFVVTSFQFVYVWRLLVVSERLVLVESVVRVFCVG